MKPLPPFVFGAPAQYAPQTGTATFDSRKLQSPFREAVWVDEMRLGWHVVGQPEAFTREQFLRFRLQFGSALVTRSREDHFVPCWSVAPTLSWHSGAARQMRWRFPRPVYLPPSTPVQLSVQNMPGSMTEYFPVSVAFAGRFAGSERPVTSQAPFATVYDAPLGAGAAQVQSGERDLVNPWRAPLFVQRLTCRMYSALNQELSGGGADVRITDSHGHDVTRDFANSLDVFDPYTLATTTDAVLMPNERYIVTVAQDALRYLSRAYIGLVGHREEVVR